MDRFIVIGAELGESDMVVAESFGGADEFDDLICDFFRCARGVISAQHWIGDQQIGLF
jgi:hypothetical protein